MSHQEMSREQIIGPYRILRALGEGGMGTVYLGYDPPLDRHVAVKVLRVREQGESASGAMIKRFMREARSAAKLNHPNVATVYAVGEIKGTPPLPYLAMEFIEGGSLADELRQTGPMAWRAATLAVRDALRALEAAHAVGIVHRDLKPANLMRATNGAVKLVDFGLARVTEGPLEEGELTFPGAFVGSPSYASPEQISGRVSLDGRSDLYSLAATWFALLTGKPPFVEEDPADVMRRHLTERFPDPREMVSAPAQLVGIMERASRRLPDERYDAARDMLAEVERLLAAAPEQESSRPIRVSASPSIEESVSALQNELASARIHADSGTQLAALRSLFSLYRQLDRREEATRVFREALVLHVRMNAPAGPMN